jgi:hypothetical protein
MKISKVIGTYVTIILFTGSTGMVYAGDACKNVEFQLINKRATGIVITSVDYDRDVVAHNPRHEDINPDLVCASGATCKTNGDDLRDSEGENLTNFVFFFNDIEADGGRSKIDQKTQPKVPDSKKCTANRTYGNSKTNPWTVN